MRTFAILAAMILMPMPAATQSVVVLSADFNDDTVGEAPDTSLPGGPEGDSLGLSERPTGSAFTVVDAAGTLTDQPLEGNRLSGPGGFGCQFRLPEGAYPCQRIVVKWCSVGVTQIPSSFMVLRGPQGAIHGSVNYRGSFITINTRLGFTFEEQVGSWTVGEGQCFEWHVDRSANRQSLYIDGEVAVEDLETSWNTAGLDVIAFQYEPSSQNGFTFAIDDVEISVVDCASPTEQRSWGEVKAAYR